MPTKEQHFEAARIIKQLQAFDPQQLSDELKKLPSGIVEVKIEDTQKGSDSYRTETITVKDPQALKKLNLKKFKSVSKHTIEATELIQRSSVFDPTVLKETQNLLPEGMIGLPPGSTVMDNNAGINFQFRFMKASDKRYWTPVIER